MTQFDALVYCKIHKRTEYESLGKPVVCMPLGYSDEGHRQMPSGDTLWACDVGFLERRKPRRERLLREVGIGGLGLANAWESLREARP